LEVTIPEGQGLFQALTLAFWKFQSVAATTLFTAVLKALQDRVCEEMTQEHPGRFRDKGRQNRTWEMPFGTIQMGLVKWLDRQTGKMVCPLKVAMDLPQRVRFCEETLLPGYRLAVLQSFRVSQKTMASQHPGQAPSHRTLHRRFQGFAGHVDPVPEGEALGCLESFDFQQADGTQLKLQQRGHDGGKADLRLVVGSQTPQGPLEVLDFSIGEAWEDIAQRLKEKFPKPAEVLVTDGEVGIAEALGGPKTVHQRCLVHARRQLKYALYQDGVKGKDQEPIEEAFSEIGALQVAQVEVNRLAKEDKITLKELLRASEIAFEAVTQRLPVEEFPATRQYVLGLVETGMAYLRQLLEGKPAPLVSTNRTESLMSRLALRLKRIGRRWSVSGGLNMLAAVLTTALHPEKYEQAEALLRGEKGPIVGVVIKSLETAWLA